MKILYFAELKELLNRSTETIHLDTTLTVQEFESYLLKHLSLIHISEPTRLMCLSRMPSSA